MCACVCSVCVHVAQVIACVRVCALLYFKIQRILDVEKDDTGTYVLNFDVAYQSGPSVF